ncbi:MAG: ATPase, T2SS/T4P/T4SS family [Candidatus Omnitrophota bacterium]|nr:Flp pilus assembly complex ATPase component TadA [Candidatus Omnitrophota bacterium]MBU1929572.1 Flp pilus assembly complex ATPase component TadA [Candidatus Omnitrophota bacterium]MBU2034159.1 Flp pilus assembly complex ATPase component TadA [Candidatus Omnitrophota bacterium]MBU2221193.1 Flp pilus assembly complex ATPase component TadA [Candidatus Omnitrophota bacterium]MBU2258801.1 Flp pilus assembly complex ATPase component TadA [Candidatus Omnitrophota bacterium]
MSKKIVIFSAKGGVGKTLIATNLAVTLARNQGSKVCLVDLDLQAAGDMARMLDLVPEKSMPDLMNYMKKQPGSIRKSEFIIKNSLGIDFLPGVLKPQQSPHVDARKIKDVFALLDKDYEYIIVDAGQHFSEVILAALNQANLVLLVVTPDVPSLSQTKWALDILQSLNFPVAMLKIILNRAESLSGISWQEVRISLPLDIIAQIPSDGEIVGAAVNRGIPVVINSPRSKITRSIEKLALDLSKNSKLFIEHQEIDQLRLKEGIVEKDGTFWQDQGLTEPLAEPEINDDSNEIAKIKRKIHARLIEELNLKRMDFKVFSDLKKTRALKDKARVLITNFLTEEAGSFISSLEDRKELVEEMLDEALGLGPLEALIADPGLTDIMVNNKNSIYVERNGKIELTNKRFISNEQVKITIERIIAPIGRRIDESLPMVDARLSDGSRVNAIIPPLSLTGPTLTIRKFRKEKLKIEDLLNFKTLSQPLAEFINACVVCRKNIIVSGGTGSGKTTILNVLSGFIPENERIITIEDAAELKLNQEHWVRLESRSPNIEGKGAITIRELFRNTLRMRPDRIIIGECRGSEILDMLQAMNTGHDGSMTTIHANSTQDVLSRIDSMILMSGVELSVRAIREMTASAIDVIIQTARLSDGNRKIVQISELAGMKDESHIDIRDIFVFKQTGIDSKNNVLGDFSATGCIPTFFQELKIRGASISEDIFKPV